MQHTFNMHFELATWQNALQQHTEQIHTASIDAHIEPSAENGFADRCCVFRYVCVVMFSI